MPKHLFALLIVTTCVLGALGCASAPYQHSTCEKPAALALREGEPQMERGRPNRFLDGVGHYLFSLPSKIILRLSASGSSIASCNSF